MNAKTGPRRLLQVEDFFDSAGERVHGAAEALNSSFEPLLGQDFTIPAGDVSDLASTMFFDWRFQGQNYGARFWGESVSAILRR
jgi:hypothetical protein